MDENWKNKVQIWMKEHQIEKVDLNLIKDALTHSSYKGMGYIVKDNERLEFLGDAVLDLIIAHQLFLDPQLSEGEMTERRKDFVSNDNLACIFDNIGLNELIRTANDFSLSVKNKADFIEAIFGAIFLDKKYERCCEFWDIIQPQNAITTQETKETFKERVHPLLWNPKNSKLEKFIGSIIEGGKLDFNFDGIRNLEDRRHLLSQYKNAKNTLQEYCQQRFLPIPEYKLINKEGFDHSPLFTVKVTTQAVIDGNLETITAIAKGSPKKTVEFKAAGEICNKLELNYN